MVELNHYVLIQEDQPLGFSFTILIMYRPPVKQMCLKVLQELSESDQEDISIEAKKRLEKFK